MVERVRSAIMQAPIFIFRNREKPFRGHFNASQFAVGGTLTQFDKSGRDLVISMFSKEAFFNKKELHRHLHRAFGVG